LSASAYKHQKMLAPEVLLTSCIGLNQVYSTEASLDTTLQWRTRWLTL